MTITVLAFAVFSYLIGSLSFGMIVSKVMGMSDPRSYGSGNPGATNMLRSGNKLASAVTLFGDGVKGWLVVALSALLATHSGLGERVIAICALAVLIGHMWPVFFGFKGGKGVATAFGVLFGFNPWLAMAALATWLLVACVLKISSLSAIIACILTPVYAYWLVGQSRVYFGSCIIMAILVVYRHKSNLLKILLSQEDKIGARSADKSPW